MSKLRVVIAAMLVVVIAVVVYACTRPAEAPPAPTADESSEQMSVAPSVEETPEESAEPTVEDVAREAATVAFTWFPAVDADRRDGWLRARDYLTDRLYDELAAGPPSEKGGGAQWQLWAEQQAKIVPEVTIGCSGCPPDTDTTAHRVAAIEQRAVTSNNSVSTGESITVWLTLVRQDDGWRIDEIRY